MGGSSGSGARDGGKTGGLSLRGLTMNFGRDVDCSEAMPLRRVKAENMSKEVDEDEEVDEDGERGCSD